MTPCGQVRLLIHWHEYVPYWSKVDAFVTHRSTI
jgi:hypothetical protein